MRGERVPEKPRAVYTGKTYDSADSVAEFFNKQGIKQSAISNQQEKAEKPLSGFDKLKSLSAEKSQIANRKSQIENGFVAGSHVRHTKYGKGLVLRREGTGDNVKLTVSFPGFGQKKLIERYANLVRA